MATTTQIKLSASQKDLLKTLPLGQQVDVATSEYSLTHTETWKPVTRYSSAGLQSLIKKGALSGNVFWRGATVTRLI